ncbi:SMI1/KNR4 family protein [Gilvimarinus agarilyticus]|uniref:SMI1/KNR4 family protein n=1 Tax=unclassified Gilvimarinus TaxID=2642066 RepID=UPI001C0967D1|nr:MULTISPECIES: SMI1/KNR4 family protein [unclassified Gilvimarinus]MBU2885652.1 SMI1/KNR4 family protein [Gilvimarinus agarilyticus]MDO6570511.1 SMI1/KNR4 family protein [Gilvimarinus sp. 2_MG-2023]MDO6747452.1 SMI1/KNR4 family protein [Gilvimarinus sp. 1_MG-2023]
MEEVIDELKSSAESVPVPLELPEEETLVTVEEEILLPIPREMRQFLLHASDVVYGSIEPVTAADPYSHTYLPEVAAQAWANGVPRHLVPLCEANGHYYCVEPEGEVVFWRDGDLTDERWPCVWDWAREVWLES